MAINVAEITSVLKREIEAFEQKLQVSEVGTVIEVGDGIARVYGLRNAMAGELLEFENGTMGQVFNLEDEAIGAVIFGNYLQIKEGDTVKSTEPPARWNTRPSSSPAPPTLRLFNTSPPTPARRWPNTSCGKASTRSWCTTT